MNEHDKPRTDSHGTALPPIAEVERRGFNGFTGTWVRARDYDALQKQSRMWELKASGTLANNLCPDHRDKQVGRPCLACEIERLQSREAALVKRVEGLEKVARAADILAHDVPPGDNRDALNRYWEARGGVRCCTVCAPDAALAEAAK